MNRDEVVIGVLGLGYVGLPLARAFARYFPVIGYDADKTRAEYITTAGDTPPNLVVSTSAKDLARAGVFIVAVPTPIQSGHRPDLRYVKEASVLISRIMRPGALVIYESTVYPGVTEEICVPLLEASGLRLNRDFSVGYSPERINPGDEAHSLEKVVKVTSGSSAAAAEDVDWLYARIVPAGTFRAASIRVAEAAKVIENTQRDLNIALMNELAIIFAKLGVDTTDVLAAAGTKWNFLPFRPGLVGGHCISVDPYYLAYRAEESGYHPDVILAGRRINDGMGSYVAERVVRLMARLDKPLGQCRLLILGATFKENCEDLRNTRVTEMVSYFREFGVHTEIWEPCGDPKEVASLMQVPAHSAAPGEKFDALVLAVAHQQFQVLTREQLESLCHPRPVIFDVKAIWPRDWVSDRL